MNAVSPPKKSRIRRATRFTFRWGLRIGLAFVLLAIVAFLVVFRGALYHRFVQFPREADGWVYLRNSRQEIAPPTGWHEYRGVFHSHSLYSHDSEVEFPEILAAAKEAGIDFIFMTDHCVEGKADYSLQWRGLHDGVLFAPGFEMSGGFMPWGLPSDTVLNCGESPEPLAATIEAKGGVLFLAHTEEDRPWDLPELDGMEIYNIHTDFKGEGFGELLPDILLSIRSYPDQVLRLVFDRQDAILAHWDELNKDRRIVGIAANDAHQNNGFRGYYTENDRFLLRMTSDDDVGEYDLNFLTRNLLRLFFGPLEPGRQLFRFDMDPYARSLRFVNTHILAQELSEKNLLDSLKQGRVFIAFDMIADATGFSVTAENANGTALLGDTLVLAKNTELVMASPVRCRFGVVHDGERIAEGEGRDYRFQVLEAGKYRVEAEVNVNDTWVPWVYTNPILVVAPSDSAVRWPAS